MNRVQSNRGIQGGTGVPPGRGRGGSGVPSVLSRRPDRLPAPVLLAGLTLGLSALPAASAGEPCHYTWVQIPNPPGLQYASGTAINELGHVTGVIGGAADTYRSFIWTPENGRVQLPMPPGVVDLRALDINDLGHIVGSMYGAEGWQGFLWDGHEYTIIERPAWATTISANALNNRDQVVGTVANVVTDPSHIFVWEAGVSSDLGALVSDTNSFGVDINEHGDVCGIAFYGSLKEWRWRSFVLSGSSVTWLTTPSSLDHARVSSLSNNGFFVGSGSTIDPIRFFGLVWTPSETHIVSAPPQFRDAGLREINDSGRAVGLYSRSGGGPIVWQGGTVYDLTTLIVPSLPPGHFTTANHINNRGQILGGRQNPTGTIVLTPVWMPGDLTGDCHVDFTDLTLVLSSYGSPQGTFPRGDVDMDGDVDLPDLAILLANWGP